MCQVAEFHGSKVAIWRGLAFPAPIRKGAGMICTLFLSSIVLLYQFHQACPPNFATLFSSPIHWLTRKIVEMGA
jgi:hypothetical protein